MSIEVGWDNNDKKTLRFIFEGKWDWDDLRSAKLQAEDLMDTVDHPVNVIVQMPTIVLPRGFLRHVKKMGRYVHRNTGTIVFVSSASIYIELVHIAWKLISRPNLPYRFAPSLEAARRMLDSAATTQAERDKP
jgi:hypothetical protein